jgi:hypothetical protein
MEHVKRKSFSYRIASRLFVSALEECDRLPDDERQLLIGEICDQLRQRMPQPNAPVGSPKVTGITIKVET